MAGAALTKSKAFAVRIIKLYKFLRDEKQEYAISRQIVRSGTSIGANLAEAEYGITRREFATKLYIALKECAETAYWLELLHDTEYLADEQYESLDRDCQEIRRMLSAATKTIRQEQ